MGELKSGWRRVKFGQLAECVNDRVDDPSQAGVERYVGLEHLDSESLTIRRWGAPEQVESTKLRFRPGDIIFGKRRAYQRKLAVADFEGICSAHAMVLRARPSEVLPEFLPFFMQSNAFMERAQAISVGSLSPTINWKTLAAEEFELPSMEEQRRMATCLLAWTQVSEAHRNVTERADALVRSAAIQEMWPGPTGQWLSGDIAPTALPAGWQLIPAADLSTDLVTKGATPLDALGTEDTGIPFLKVYNLTFTGQLDFTVNPTWISRAGHQELRRSIVRPGDVLMNIVGPPLGKVARVPPGFAECNINQAIVRYRPRSKELGDWLELYLLTPIAQGWLAKRSKKTSGQKNLTLEMCRELPVPIPDDLSGALERLGRIREAADATVRRWYTTTRNATIALEHILQSGAR